MTTVGDLRKIFDDCWFRIVTNIEEGEEITIFDQEKEDCNIPSFIETIPVHVAFIDYQRDNTIIVYLKNEYCEKE